MVLFLLLSLFFYQDVYGSCGKKWDIESKAQRFTRVNVVSKTCVGFENLEDSVRFSLFRTADTAPYALSPKSKMHEIIRNFEILKDSFNFKLSEIANCVYGENVAVLTCKVQNQNEFDLNKHGLVPFVAELNKDAMEQELNEKQEAAKKQVNQFTEFGVFLPVVTLSDNSTIEFTDLPTNLNTERDKAQLLAAVVLNYAVRGVPTVIPIPNKQAFNGIKGLLNELTPGVPVLLKPEKEVYLKLDAIAIAILARIAIATNDAQDVNLFTIAGAFVLAKIGTVDEGIVNEIVQRIVSGIVPPKEDGEEEEDLVMSGSENEHLITECAGIIKNFLESHKILAEKGSASEKQLIELLTVYAGLAEYSNKTQLDGVKLYLSDLKTAADGAKVNEPEVKRNKIKNPKETVEQKPSIISRVLTWSFKTLSNPFVYKTMGAIALALAAFKYVPFLRNLIRK